MLKDDKILCESGRKTDLGPKGLEDWNLSTKHSSTQKALGGSWEWRVRFS
jgi:hypothetical protein